MLELEPYLFFYGKCEEALNFYKGIFGGQVAGIMRMKEAPHEMQAPANWADKIMHSRFESATVRFMASDGMPDTVNTDGNIALSLSTKDEAEGTRVFNKLSEGGKVDMPMQDMFWGAKFGVLKDKYGIEWMVSCDKP
jgi:PhnB protein